MPTVSGIALRQLLGTMLLELPSKDIHDFWGRHSLKNGRSLKGNDLLNTFWETDKSLPLPYVLGVLDSVEDFLFSRSLPVEPFVGAFCEKINNGSLLPPSIALKAVNRVMNIFFRGNSDIRETLLKLVQFGNACLVIFP